MNKINKNKGFTLIELMSTIGVAMILMSIAVPSFQGMLKKNRVTALHNELLSSLNFARSTAITTGSWATFCHSNLEGTACTNPSSAWTNGWIVFSDRDNDGVVDTNETILSVVSGVPAGINIFSNNNRISYGSQGYAIGYAGKITFCDKTSNSPKGGMIISANGRVRKAGTSDTLASCSGG